MPYSALYSISEPGGATANDRQLVYDRQHASDDIGGRLLLHRALNGLCLLPAVS